MPDKTAAAAIFRREPSSVPISEKAADKISGFLDNSSACSILPSRALLMMHPSFQTAARPADQCSSFPLRPLWRSAQIPGCMPESWTAEALFPSPPSGARALRLSCISDVRHRMFSPLFLSKISVPSGLHKSKEYRRPSQLIPPRSHFPVPFCSATSSILSIRQPPSSSFFPRTFCADFNQVGIQRPSFHCSKTERISPAPIFSRNAYTDMSPLSALKPHIQFRYAPS